MLTTLEVFGVATVVAVFLLSLRRRRRGPAQVDTAVFFGVLVVQIALSAVSKVQGGAWTTAAQILLVAEPLLWVRLLRHFWPVPVWLHRVMWVSFGVAAAAVAAREASALPTAVFGLLVLYVFLANLTGCIVCLVRGRRLGGSSRQRVFLASFGAFGFAGGLMAEGLLIAAPATAPVTGPVMELGLFIVGFGFFFAFTPPERLLRLWDATELTRLHDDLREAGTDRAAVGDALLAAASRVTRQPSRLASEPMPEPGDVCFDLETDPPQTLVARLDAHAPFAEDDKRLLQRMADAATLAFVHVGVLEEAQDREAFKSRFLRAMAHEIANPLGPVRVQTHLLKAGAVDLERALPIVDRSVDRIEALITQMRDVARLESAKMEIELQAVDAAALAEEAVDAHHEIAESGGCRLSIDTVEAPIKADPVRIGQVLDNLLSNAIKYSPDGGEIRIDVTNTDRIRIRVTDPGLGFDPGEAAALFEPYRRLHKDDSPKTQGVGLGLFIARGIMRLHGGDLQADSPGRTKGSTFTMVLPPAPDAETT